MSLNKAIEHNKEKRKPYVGSKAIDPSCRNNCGCDWCKENRMIHSLKQLERTQQDLNDYLLNQEETES